MGLSSMETTPAREAVAEQGGRVYEVMALSSDRIELRFGRDAIDLGRLRVGQRLWKTDDPELTARLRQSYQGPPSRLVDLDFEVQAELGLPLRIEVRTATGYHASVRTSSFHSSPPDRKGPTRLSFETSSAAWEARSIGSGTFGPSSTARPWCPRACSTSFAASSSPGWMRLPRRPPSGAWPPDPCCRRCWAPIAAERRSPAERATATAFVSRALGSLPPDFTGRGSRRARHRHRLRRLSGHQGIRRRRRRRPARWCVDLPGHAPHREAR